MKPWSDGFDGSVNLDESEFGKAYEIEIVEINVLLWITKIFGNLRAHAGRRLFAHVQCDTEVVQEPLQWVLGQDFLTPSIPDCQSYGLRYLYYSRE